ncbi:DUF3244 domain-containing protein [Bacteroides faecium]|uniref:DUF3244 domain-containing protein n=1 Tax=Bacteroides faecium TaxID=2715212 RepID=A0A6H0KKF5_9BACE|nr:DUF3244 domain-containing protein [Bacteroides faecium]QIU93840.1 DUF3244 domain-containing protein [Bacteroides faecium]
MKRLSIVLLIGISFMTMEANTLSEHRTKRLVIKIWHQHREVPVSIPIEAILDENSIEVRFLEHVDKQVIFQVKDQQGNIMFQDVIVTPNEAEVYKIDLKGYKVGHYEFFYIEGNMPLIGEFEIEHSIH